MSLEEKFNAAVNVIRSLPKSGKFRNSIILIIVDFDVFCGSVICLYPN